jgi:hypothetical protein
VSHSSDAGPLSQMKNLDLAKERVGFSKLVVTHSRPLNLQNTFSVRNIHGRGKKVSQYLAYSRVSFLFMGRHSEFCLAYPVSCVVISFQLEITTKIRITIPLSLTFCFT